MPGCSGTKRWRWGCELRTAPMTSPASLIDRLKRDGERIVVELGHRVRDERLTHPLTGLPLGEPLCWARAPSSQACAAVVRACREHGVRVVPLASGTAFWDPVEVAGAVVLDTLAIDRVVTVDRERRLVVAGAGARVGDVDRAARREGLCLPAYPDAGSDTPVATILSVGSTAGMGAARLLPVEQVSGACVVTGDGALVHAGTAFAFSGRPFLREGRPSLLGLISGAQGHAGIITEVGLLLEPALPLAELRLTGRCDAVTDVARSALAAARVGIDERVLDTLRIELGTDARRSTFEILIRTFDATASRAAAASERIAAPLGELGLEAQRVVQETERARRGLDPDYEWRFTVPAGEHRSRLAGGAFWGVEVSVSWGAELDVALERLQALYDASASLDPLHRRLGMYAGKHTVSIGVQLLVKRAPEHVQVARRLLADALDDLLDVGAVPYRDGGLWGPAIRRFEARHAIARETFDRVRACQRGLDSGNTIASRRASATDGDIDDV